LVTGSHRILGRWRNHFSELLNVHEVYEFRQREIYTTEPLVPEPVTFAAELVTEEQTDTNYRVFIKSRMNRLKQL